MIRPISWYWRQFGGSHIEAVLQGIYRAVVNAFDDKLDYFNNFSIATAEDNHLTVIGFLSGITRCIIKVTSETYFYFTRVIEHDNDHGVSVVPNGTERPVGGQFIDLYDPEFTETNQLAPAGPFRRLLELASQSRGSVRPVVSLRLLDDLLAYTTGRAYYQIQWFQEPRIEDSRTVGDLLVLIDQQSWGGSALAYRDSLDGAVNNIDNPVHHVTFEFSSLGEENTITFGSADFYGGYAVKVDDNNTDCGKLMLDVVEPALDDLYGTKTKYDYDLQDGVPCIIASWRQPFSAERGMCFSCDFVYGEKHWGTYDEDTQTFNVDSFEYSEEEAKVLFHDGAIYKKGDAVRISWMESDGQGETDAFGFPGVDLVWDGLGCYIQDSSTKKPLWRIRYNLAIS